MIANFYATNYYIDVEGIEPNVGLFLIGLLDLFYERDRI